MQRNFLIWLVLFILSLVAITNYGGPISYGFFVMVAAVPVAAILYLVYVVFCFRIYQELDTNRLTTNETVPFLFRLINENRLAFAGIRVFFYSSFSAISDLEDGVEYELMPQTGIERQTGLVCRYRGEYEVGIKTVVIQDFFRLFSYSYQNRPAIRVVVRPQLVNLKELKGSELVLSLGRESGSDTEPDVTLRDYVPGDDVRMMHWRASAANAKLMIRKKTGDRQKGIGILFSTNRREKRMHRYLPVENKILETVLAVAHFYAVRNVPVLTHYLQEEVREIAMDGVWHFDAYYDLISGVEFGEGQGDEKLFAEVSKTRNLLDCKAIFLVISSWENSTADMIRQLNENGIYAMVYLVNNEGLPKEEERNLKMELIHIGSEDSLAEVIG